MLKIDSYPLAYSFWPASFISSVANWRRPKIYSASRSTSALREDFSRSQVRSRYRWGWCPSCADRQRLVSNKSVGVSILALQARRRADAILEAPDSLWPSAMLGREEPM